MAWLEHHESWINRWPKALGAMHTVPGVDLKVDEITSARKKKRHWRETLDDSVSLLDIRMLEMVLLLVIKNTRVFSKVLLDNKTAPSPLIDIRFGHVSLTLKALLIKSNFIKS